jgi:hypothetical protein
MMVEEKKKKERTKEKNKKDEEGEKGGLVFWNLRESWASEKKKKVTHLNVWFGLNGLGSSQNGQNSLIHNWCMSWCWFTQTNENWLCCFMGGIRTWPPCGWTVCVIGSVQPRFLVHTGPN